MSLSPQLDRLEIETRGPLDGQIRVPGSKSITNRALLLAALADGESELSGGLESDDTIVMRAALLALGISVENENRASGERIWRIGGQGGRLEIPIDPLDCGNSGTTVRFLTAALTIAPGGVIVDGNDRMRERPIGDLLAALRDLGAELTCSGSSNCPPVHVGGGGLPGGKARIDASRSSQYVSAVLQAAPYAERDVELSFKDDIVVSRPYIDLTIQIMREFGAQVEWRGDAPHQSIFVKAGQTYQPRRYEIESDASSAAYPFCAAAIAGGQVTVTGIPPDSLQADLRILDLLERMGCRIVREADRVTVLGSTAPLRSLGEVDMNDFPDAVLAYAVVALFADGPTTIKNVANLRIKETDRLDALARELRKLGARAETGYDWLRIQPGPLRGASIDTYDDHRIAMSFALAGLRVPGVVIIDPGCVSKTWPDYFEAFSSL